MTTATFDKTTLPAVRADLDEALRIVGMQHGITLRLGNMTYDPSGTSFRVTLEAKTGGFSDHAAKEAVNMAKAYGVDASEPSDHPTHAGARLVQYDHKRRSRPWVYELRGKRYITNDDGLRILWPAKIAAA